MQSLLALSLVGLANAAEFEKRGGSEEPIDYFHEAVNDKLARYTILALGLAAAAMYIFSLASRFNGHLRRLSSFNDGQQRYFVSAHEMFAFIKDHLIYAPLFCTRHNREFQLSTAVNMGNLPSRFHGLLIVGVVAMNVILCVNTVPYQSEEDTVASVVRNRTGTMATVNLIPLVLMAGRNNPLIALLRVPFDTWNLLHRWLGRIVVLEALAHTFAWIVPMVQKGKSRGIL